MNLPKLAIVSDGEYTGVLLDGVFIGEGIRRLDFSTENKDGEMETMIRIMDLNVHDVKLSTGSERFVKFMERIAQKKTAPVSGEHDPDEACEKQASLQVDGKEFAKAIISHKEAYSPIETIQKAVETAIRGTAEAENRS